MQLASRMRLPCRLNLKFKAAIMTATLSYVEHLKDIRSKAQQTMHSMFFRCKTALIFKPLQV